MKLTLFIEKILKQCIESGNTLKIPPTEVSVKIQDVNKCLLDEK